MPHDPRITKHVNDLRGRRFGRLVVSKLHHISEGADKHAYWLCDCDCGSHPIVRGTRMTRQVSCGCWRADPAVRSAARYEVDAGERKRLAKIRRKA
jgi:hypothetical protein